MTYDQYSLSDITIDTISTHNNTLEITYRTKLETLYYSPGIIVKHDNNDLILTFVRCSINDACKVDIKSTIKDGNNHILLEIPRGNIFLNKEKTKKIEFQHPNS